MYFPAELQRKPAIDLEDIRLIYVANSEKLKALNFTTGPLS